VGRGLDLRGGVEALDGDGEFPGGGEGLVGSYGRERGEKG
jgi:hypothetical protein